jgi:hypothetical protein
LILKIFPYNPQAPTKALFTFKSMTPSRNKSGIPRPRLDCHPAILEGASSPQGFGPLEGRHISVNLHRVCRRMTAAGLLYVGKPSKRVARYFLAQADADVFAVAYLAQIKENERLRKEAQAKGKKRVRAKAPPKVKPPKPPKPIKPPRAVKPKAIKPAARPAPTPLFNIARKPYVAPVRVKAVIVWPEGVKHTILPTPTPRFAVVSHNFVHSGMRQMA